MQVRDILYCFDNTRIVTEVHQRMETTRGGCLYDVVTMVIGTCQIYSLRRIGPGGAAKTGHQ